MWQDNTNPYGASSGSSQHYQQPQMGGGATLQFYAPSATPDQFYAGSRPSLDGHMAAAQGSIGANGVAQGYGGNIAAQAGWWTAFGTGGFEGEPPLLEGPFVIDV